MVIVLPTPPPPSPRQSINFQNTAAAAVLKQDVSPEGRLIPLSRLKMFSRRTALYVGMHGEIRAQAVCQGKTGKIR